MHTYSCNTHMCISMHVHVILWHTSAYMQVYTCYTRHACFHMYKYAYSYDMCTYMSISVL